MNIFFLDSDPKKAAQYHCDKHVVKMILETVQLLSTTCRLSGFDIGYKITHKNHPCTVWVRESQENYDWTFSLLEELHTEWKKRFNHPENKTHKSYDVAKTLPRKLLRNKGFTKPALAMPEYLHSDNPVVSYRNYYMKEKFQIVSWKTKTPDWWKNKGE